MPANSSVCRRINIFLSHVSSRVVDVVNHVLLHFFIPLTLCSEVLNMDQLVVLLRFLQHKNKYLLKI